MHYWRIGRDQGTLKTGEKCFHTNLFPNSAYSDNCPPSRTNGTNTLLFREAQHNALPCSSGYICTHHKNWHFRVYEIVF